MSPSLKKNSIIFSGILACALQGCGGGTPPERSHPDKARPSGTSSPAPTPPGAIQGGSVGNGGDDRPMGDGSAWFLGTRDIRVCVSRASDFGASSHESVSAVEFALNEWADYLSMRRINSPRSFPERGIREGDPSLVMNHVLLPRCDGTEDLTFYLGMENDSVRRSRARYSNPVAFAQKTTFEPRVGWGKGYIWVQSSGKHSTGFPRWQLPDTLKAILLHEVGHALGCSHVSGTVMRENIVDYIRAATEGRLARKDLQSMASIDQERVLLLPSDPLSFELYVSIFDGQPVGLEARSVPWKRTNEDRSGVVILHRRSAFTVSKFTSELDTVETLVSYLVEVARHRNDAPIFQMTFERPGSTGEPVTITSHSVSVVLVGQMRIESGIDSIPVLIDYNGSGYRIRIVTWGPVTDPRELFRF